MASGLYKYITPHKGLSPVRRSFLAWENCMTARLWLCYLMEKIRPGTRRSVLLGFAASGKKNFPEFFS